MKQISEVGGQPREVGLEAWGVKQRNYTGTFYWLLKQLAGEGNGNPLQYSCLETPMYGGAWQAAVHGVAQGWTRLKQLSSSSSSSSKQLAVSTELILRGNYVLQDTTERLHFHFHALEKEMATHSSVLAWRIPGTEEPGGLPSMGSHRVGHD